MSTERGTRHLRGQAHSHADAHHRAASAGLLVTTLGVVIVNIAPFLDWVRVEAEGGADGPQRTGYETDSLVPFAAYLGIGLLLALFYASSARFRSRGRRGLSLVSMAIGIAVTLQCIAFSFQPMGGLERGEDLAVQWGVFVGILGAALWSIGSGLLVRADELHDEDLRGEWADTPDTRPRGETTR